MRHPDPERHSTTWYLQQEKLKTHEVNELARRIQMEVRQICEIVLKRRFPKLQRETRRTDIADKVIMEMLKGWRGFKDRNRFRKAVFRYAKHVLIDMTRYVGAKKRRPTGPENSVGPVMESTDVKLSREEGDVAEGILRSEEHQWLSTTLSQMEHDRPDLAEVLALKIAGLRLAEIAARLDISSYQVKRLIQAAVEVLTSRAPPEWLAP